LSDEPIDLKKDADEYLDLEYRKTVRCKIFLGYTSNMVSCGLRETLRFLVQHKMVDCLVTSAGGIEEDLMKCLIQLMMMNLFCILLLYSWRSFLSFYEVFCFAQKIFNHTKFLQPNTKLFQY
jgi:hypothetical protein